MPGDRLWTPASAGVTENMLDISYGLSSALLHHLVLVDTPKIAALDPAGMVGGVDAAPIGAAFEELGNDTRFSARNGRRSYVRLAMESADPALDDNGPLACEHSL